MVMPVPYKAVLQHISQRFWWKWNFPNSVGAIDRKHVHIEAPPKSGSSFHNYKHTHSIVLLASCEADFNFTSVDIGNYGRISDGGVFADTALGKALSHPESFVPPDALLPNDSVLLACVFAANAAFPLR